MESLEKGLLILFGWLLGLLAPAIVDSIRKRREAKEVKIAVLPELHELQYRLAMVIYLIERRYGQINREFIEWIQPIMQGYRGVDSSVDSSKHIEFLLSLSEDQLAELAQITQTPGRGLSLKKYSLPFLDSKLASLTWFDETLRSQLLEIKYRIRTP